MSTLPRSLHWLGALQQPELALRWSLPQWEYVLRLSRRLRLLGRLAERLHGADLMAQVPRPAAEQLTAEMNYSRWRINMMRWTVERLSPVLADLGHPAVLLKGAAYVAQGLPIAAGRQPSDLDILVPQAVIARTRTLLAAGGWAEIELDTHDQRYYEAWSHEIPPMHHPVLPLELDLHHTILPPVAKVSVDADLLLQQLQPSPWRGWQVLHPYDQVLHSAAHLFHDADLRDRLRDIVDLDGLMRHFSTHDPQFWPGLHQRAQVLGLGEALALACHFTRTWLNHPVPPMHAAAIMRGLSNPVRRSALQALFGRALRPSDPDGPAPAFQSLAVQALLARYHLHRMPMRLLVPHLWHKAGKLRAARKDRAAASRVRLKQETSDA